MSIGFVRGMLPDLKKKYEVVLLSSPGPEMEEAKKAGLARCIAVPMERHISPLKDIVGLCKLIRVFRKERPDMVHSMTPKAGLLCMTAGWLTGVPVRIHTFTGLVFPTSTGLKKRILMLTDAITCWCATHVIPEGEGVKADLLDNGITHKPLRVLGYGNVRGIDLEKWRTPDAENAENKRSCKSRRLFNHESHTESTESTEKRKNTNCTNEQEERTTLSPRGEVERGLPFSFLFVGRIVRDKGINELVEAFCRLNKEMPETRLVLVGFYEQRLDPVSEETQREIESNPNIIMAGEVTGDSLIKKYAAADCFVFPSYREGFPNTVLEAGAMSLPCIVTDINGSREIITNENHADIAEDAEEKTKLTPHSSLHTPRNESLSIKSNGIIIPSKDAEALYEAMKLMVTEDEMREAMARNARPMIESRFEQGFVRQCLYDFYEEVL